MDRGGASPSCCCLRATAYSSRMFRSLRIALPSCSVLLSRHALTKSVNVNRLCKRELWVVCVKTKDPQEGSES